MSNVVHWPKHLLERHEHCDNPGCCPICDGGLSYCRVCSGAEGSLPCDCPGEPMTDDQATAVYNGTLDFRVKLGGWTEWSVYRENVAKNGGDWRG